MVRIHVWRASSGGAHTLLLMYSPRSLISIVGHGPLFSSVSFGDSALRALTFPLTLRALLCALALTAVNWRVVPGLLPREPTPRPGAYSLHKC